MVSDTTDTLARSFQETTGMPRSVDNRDLGLGPVRGRVASSRPQPGPPAIVGSLEVGRRGLLLVLVERRQGHAHVTPVEEEDAEVVGSLPYAPLVDAVVQLVDLCATHLTREEPLDHLQEATLHLWI